jgi:hypothetical protein
METPIEFLTVEECHQVDAALLSSREKFTARVAIYALRSLKTIADEQNCSVVDLSEEAITRWIAMDQSLANEPNEYPDGNFLHFFVKIVLAARKPLREIAGSLGLSIEQVTVAQVIAWYEVQAKANLETQG